MWSKVSLLGFLLLLLFAVPFTFSQDNETIEKLRALQLEYQTVTEKLNILSVQSSLDLMTLTTLLPELQKQVTLLQQTVTKLIEESERLAQDSIQLTAQLQQLSDEISKLLGQLEQQEILILDLERSLKDFQTRDIITLSVGILAIVGVIILFFKKN